jgi:hypothetical protein
MPALNSGAQKLLGKGELVEASGEIEIVCHVIPSAPTPRVVAVDV